MLVVFDESDDTNTTLVWLKNFRLRRQAGYTIDHRVGGATSTSLQQKLAWHSRGRRASFDCDSNYYIATISSALLTLRRRVRFVFNCSDDYIAVIDGLMLRRRVGLGMRVCFQLLAAAYL